MESKARDSRDKILKAAVSVFARKGYHGTRMSDVAREAGVAYGLVYHYFGSKENVLKNILEAVERRLSLRIERIGRESDLTLNEKLGKISDYMFDTYLANPDIIHLLVQEVVRSNQDSQLGQIESFTRLLGRIEAIMAKAVESGELGPDEDPQLDSIVFFGAVQLVLTGLVQGFYRISKNRVSGIREIKRKMRKVLASGSFGQPLMPV